MKLQNVFGEAHCYLIMAKIDALPDKMAKL